MFIKSFYSSNQVLVAVGWTLALASGLMVMFGLIPYLREDVTPEINPFIRIAYGSLHHFAWASSTGWVIVTCVHGYGGKKVKIILMELDIINWILLQVSSIEFFRGRVSFLWAD